MILRPLAAPAHPSSVAGPEPVWSAIERSQQQDFSAGCWLIPQPAHAALAGDLARQLSPRHFPDITPEVVRGIALHDSGWSPDDANAIQDSRARGVRSKPSSFLFAAPRDTVAAWVGSIEIAGKGSPVSGYLVSRHFSAIAEVYRSRADARTTKLLADFIAQEDSRRQKLRKKVPHSDAQLDRLVEALQFCDLLSLYLCCGLEGEVEFPQKVAGKPVRLRALGEQIALTPAPLVAGASFNIAAIRHPKTNASSSAVFAVYVGGEGEE